MEEGVNTASTNAAVENQLIPKARLDEEIAKARQAQGEVQALRGIVNNLTARTSPQPVEKESPEMLKQKEENPTQYAINKRILDENKKIRAAMYVQNEQSDVKVLVEVAGSAEKANAYAQQIESYLEAQRRRGNSPTRADIYLMLKGQEALQRDRNPVKKEAVVEARTNYDDVPLSDPKAQGATSSAARVVGSEQSLEELERRVLNEEI